MTHWWDLPCRAALRTSRVLGFVGYFIGRLVLANLVVAREVVTPGTGILPGIVDFPSAAVTQRELVVFSLVIGLTPGTLTVAVSEEPPAVFVHGMYAGDMVLFRRQLAELERRLLLAMRPVGRQPSAARPARPVPRDRR